MTQRHYSNFLLLYDDIADDSEEDVDCSDTQYAVGSSKDHISTNVGISSTSAPGTDGLFRKLMP